MPNQPKTPVKCFRIPEAVYQAAKRRAELEGSNLSARVNQFLSLYADADPEPAETETKGHDACQHKAYRLSCEDYDALLAEAHGACQRCTGVAGRYDPLEIDHDHRFGYGAVRGLVCGRCNKILGRADRGEDETPDPVTLRYLANAWYLREATQ